MLLEKAGEIYGEWSLLVNTDGLFTVPGPRRPNPFAIPLDELEGKIHYIGVMSAIQMTLQPFNIDYIKQFISEYA